ncbi:SH3 domain-containing protein [Erythrobacter sp. SDW2]|uniref:SH3 domain-containing protein n=1 Tax=Erythrobacter sp. SDW2 TaxID=2907154 RepID=UPI001F195788|nr:SH3 domain-containing protein [Erythrobacter sp. SDW2]UIP07955.1 SH3 domain-containing protein [Erythrobacter sp. SDW2]
MRARGFLVQESDMRVLAGVLIVVAAAGAIPAWAQGDIPGPFACSLGDSQVVLYANEDASEYAGELAPAGDYAAMDSGEPRLLTLRQKYNGWRTVYENAEMTMVINADAAQLYGAFGTSECFASRSVAVGESWRGGGQLVSGEGQRWTEWAAPGGAITWGGNVRSGPGQEFKRVAGVPLGVNVETIAVTDRTWLDEYPWYKVRLPDGTEGYIAGGLLCSREGRSGMYNERDCTG